MSSLLNVEFDVSRSLRSSPVSDLGSNEVLGKTMPSSPPSSSTPSQRRNKPTFRRLTHRASNIEHLGLPLISLPGQKASGPSQRRLLDFQDPIKVGARNSTNKWKILEPRWSRDSLLQRVGKGGSLSNLVESKARMNERKHSDLDLWQNRSVTNRSNLETDFGLRTSRSSRSVVDTEGFKPMVSARNKLSAITFLLSDSIPAYGSVKSESSKKEDQCVAVSATEIRKSEKDSTVTLNPVNLRGQNSLKKKVLLLETGAKFSSKINVKSPAQDETRPTVDCQLPLPPNIIVIKDSDESDDQEPATPATTDTISLNGNTVANGQSRPEEMTNIGFGTLDEKSPEVEPVRSNGDNVVKPVLKRAGWRPPKREATKIKRTRAKPIRSAELPKNNAAGGELDIAPVDLLASPQELSRSASGRLRDREATIVSQATNNSVDHRLLIRVLSGDLTDIPPVPCHVVRIFTSSTFTGKFFSKLINETLS